MKRILPVLIAVLALGTLALAQTQNKAPSTYDKSSSSDTVQITNGPGVQNITGTTATVFWNTSAPSGAVVRYGTARDKMSETAQESWGQTAHSVELKNLQPSTTYFFQVESSQTQSAGSTMKSGIGTFKTKAQ